MTYVCQGVNGTIKHLHLYTLHYQYTLDLHNVYSDIRVANTWFSAKIKRLRLHWRQPLPISSIKQPKDFAGLNEFYHFMQSFPSLKKPQKMVSE